jgi:hypothetical protein
MWNLGGIHCLHHAVQWTKDITLHILEITSVMFKTVPFQQGAIKSQAIPSYKTFKL